MNRSPVRHPAFVAIACLSMAGAWSTGAFEIEQAMREPASVDRVALLRDAPDCHDVSGPRRALCIYESRLTAPTAAITDASRPATAVPTESARYVAASERSTPGRASDRSLLAPRSPSTTSAMSR